LSVISSHTHLADRLSGTTVLVVGDLMLDRYYWGDVRRISPEAPVPVVKVNEKTYRLGGAGNVAANLSGLGCSVAVIGLIGDDAASGQIKDLLASLNHQESLFDRCRAPHDHQNADHGQQAAGGAAGRRRRQRHRSRYGRTDP
jgi:bifunctional ADP-heptose synthase (sugar kinase/adenylyltransferase)